MTSSARAALLVLAMVCIVLLSCSAPAEAVNGRHLLSKRSNDDNDVDVGRRLLAVMHHMPQAWNCNTWCRFIPPATRANDWHICHKCPDVFPHHRPTSPRHTILQHHDAMTTMYHPNVAHDSTMQHADANNEDEEEGNPVGRRLSMLSQHGKPRHHKGDKGHMPHKGYSTHHQEPRKHVTDTVTTAGALKGAMVDSHHKAMESHHKAVEKHVADNVATALTHYAGRCNSWCMYVPYHVKAHSWHVCNSCPSTAMHHMRHCSAWCVHVPQHIKAHSQHFCHSCKADDKQIVIPKDVETPEDNETPKDIETPTNSETPKDIEMPKNDEMPKEDEPLEPPSADDDGKKCAFWCDTVPVTIRAEFDQCAECGDDDMMPPIQKMDQGPGEEDKTGKVDTTNVSRGKTNTIVIDP